MQHTGHSPVLLLYDTNTQTHKTHNHLSNQGRTENVGSQCEAVGQHVLGDMVPPSYGSEACVDRICGSDNRSTHTFGAFSSQKIAFCVVFGLISTLDNYFLSPYDN